MLQSEELATVLPALQNLKDPQTVDEAVEQLAIISQAMERCEKILQTMALSRDGEGLAKFTAFYRQLISLEQYYTNKRTAVAVAGGQGEQNKPVAASKNWWNFWKK